ncbi:MAG TPA: cytochrome P450 [Cellvibrionales bacterium]|nr:cytochrome P450 [Cellvibrionales bacterium]
MSKCPFHNIRDPDFYTPGHHQEKLVEMRAMADAPIVKVDDPIRGEPYWVVMDRTTADYICKHPLIFSSEEKSCIPKEFDEIALEQQKLMLVNMDPPHHQKYRRIARNAFTPRAVEAYHEIFEVYAKQIVDSVASKGECEFITEVAAELPLMAILDMMSVPKEDRKKVFTWTNEMFFQEDEDIGGADAEAKAMEASANIYLYAGELARKHAESPLNNIVGALLDGQVNDENLTEDEFQAFFLMLIAAGNESTRSVTAHGMRLLMENPDQLQKLIDDPELIPDACEEMLRYNPAFIQMQRTVMEDTEYQGVQMKKGDLVMLNWHIINMDAELFESPLEFNVTRAQDMPLHREHRAFGNGEHFCLGAHLARLELHIMFKELLPRLRNPKFAKPVQYVRDNLVNGIKEMQITFDPEAA